MMNVLEVNHLRKSFGQKTVLSDVSFEVRPNEIYGFIGGNGQGKTTTMKMILGLLKIHAGDVLVSGERVTFGETKTNQNVGYLPDVPQFYEFMTAREYLKLCADVTNIPKEKSAARIDELLELVSLSDINTKIKGYSRGMKQRLGVAQALIHKPRLLICDEPTSALDPKGRRDILSILKSIKHETTVIFSTHILSDVEHICDRVGILKDGIIVKELDFKKDKLPHGGVILSLDNADATKLSEVLPLEPRGTQYFIAGIELKELYEILHAHGVYPSTLEQARPSLEDIYLEVT